MDLKVFSSAFWRTPRRVKAAGPPKKNDEAEEATRLELFVDAVYAVVATVLYLPLNSNLDESEEQKEVEALDLLDQWWPAVLTFLIVVHSWSGQTLLGFWSRGQDDVATVLQFAIVACVSLLPFMALTLGAALQSTGAPFSYAILMILMASFNVCQWLWLASRAHKLSYRAWRRSELAYRCAIAGASMPGALLAAILCWFIDPPAAVVSFLFVTPVVRIIVRRVYAKYLLKHPIAASPYIGLRETPPKLANAAAKSEGSSDRKVGSDNDELISMSEREDDDNDIGGGGGDDDDDTEKTPLISAANGEAAKSTTVEESGFRAWRRRRFGSISEAWHPGACSKERLLVFTDAVLAFSATLIAADLRVSSEEWSALQHDRNGMAELFDAKWPYLTAFAWTFVLIMAIWFAHDRMLRGINFVPRSLFWLSALCISQVPALAFTCKFVLLEFKRDGNDGTLNLALLCASLNQVWIGVWLGLMFMLVASRQDIWHASYRSLYLDRRYYASMAAAALTLFIVPAIALILSHLHITASFVVLLLTLPLLAIVILATPGFRIATRHQLDEDEEE
jgi:uncharacterized membrane protein